MSPDDQITLLRQASFYHWCGQERLAHTLLEEVAISLDNPTYVLPKWLGGHTRKASRDDRKKVQYY